MTWRVCAHDRRVSVQRPCASATVPHRLTQVTRCRRRQGGRFYFLRGTKSAEKKKRGLGREASAHLSYLLVFSLRNSEGGTSWSLELVCERHLFTVTDHYSCDYASHFFFPPPRASRMFPYKIKKKRKEKRGGK